MSELDTQRVGDSPRIFDQVAEEYDAARPHYPEGLYHALQELSGVRFDGAVAVDVGAGTGISARGLLARGAQVIAVDPAARMLGRLKARTAISAAISAATSAGISTGISTGGNTMAGGTGGTGNTTADAACAALRADGNALPLRDGVADLVTYAQSWHWLDSVISIAEAVRVLRPGGAVAGWWNTVDPGKADWLAAYQVRLAESCPGYMGPALPGWSMPPIAVAMAGAGLDVTDTWVYWTRRVGLEEFLTDLRSHSYVASLDPGTADRLIGRERDELGRVFTNGDLVVPMRVYLAVGRRP